MRICIEIGIRRRVSILSFTDASVLASASPRRAELLRAAGYRVRTSACRRRRARPPGRGAAAYVRRLATEKSARRARQLLRFGRPATVRRSGPPAVVLGADTAVVVDGEILGKPRDDEEAGAMLRRLSGRPHEVLTGVSLRARARRGRAGRDDAGRRFAADRRRDRLVRRSGEGRDKAGAYAIQGLASRFIPRIDGSYSNVVGLPVAARDRADATG